MKANSLGWLWACLCVQAVPGSWELAAGTIDFGYDATGRMVQLDNVEEVYRTYYTFDGSGNLTEVSIVHPPTITAGPVDLQVAVGETASFSVAVDGGGSITYQWRKNGLMLANATLAELILANAQKADAGDYHVQVSNELGSVESDVASLTVTGGTGDPQLIAPFEDAEYLGERVFNTWMGLVYLPEGETTEVYLHDQGWISIGLALGDGGMWYWDYAMVEWAYTNPVFYPNIYLPSLQWLLYWDPFSNVNTRWFYRYADDGYYSWPRYPGPLPYE